MCFWCSAVCNAVCITVQPPCAPCMRIIVIVQAGLSAHIALRLCYSLLASDGMGGAADSQIIFID